MSAGSARPATHASGHTAKQWGRPCHELPSSIIKRLPIRFTWDDRYFSDRYEGLPTGGYSAWIEAMLDGIDLDLGLDYFELANDKARRTIYTGPLDELYHYDAGTLEYRSLSWQMERHDGDYQGVTAINYTHPTVPWTRIVEWKHFRPDPPPDVTWIAVEYPQEWRTGMERYYPINNAANDVLAQSYKLRARHDGIILAGRLATYRYMDMDQVIGQAIVKAERLL